MIRFAIKSSIILLFFIEVSCSTTQNRDSTSFRVCDFNPSVNNAKLPQPPFVREFLSDKGRIVFIAAEHGEEPQNKKTFDLIREAFAKGHFHMSIVESLEHDQGVSPSKYLQDYKDGHYLLGEPIFLALTSVQKGVDFTGGEISEQELVNQLKQVGFSQKDIAGLYILRGWGARSELSIEKLIADKRFPVTAQFSSATDFLDWFRVIKGSELPTQRDPTLSKPFQDRQDRLEELSNEITWARDRYLSKVIKKEFESKGDVIVVYGSGHYLPQECFIQSWINN